MENDKRMDVTQDEAIKLSDVDLENVSGGEEPAPVIHEENAFYRYVMLDK